MDIKSESAQDSPDQNEGNATFNHLTVLTFLALLIFFTMLISAAVSMLLETVYGISLADAITQLSDADNSQLRNYVRLTLGINHTLVFMLPPLVVAMFFYRKKWVDFLQLRFTPAPKIIKNSLYGILLILSAFPLALFTFWLNKQIPLPEWAKSIEDSTNTLLRNMLGTESSLELLFNLLVLAIIPAIGEELLFRGVIQRTLEKWTYKPHLAILVTAFIFSAFHMQFEGFVPRFLLGAMLGYLLYWSGSLWVPIIAHFANNAMQVIAMYLYSRQMSEIDIDQIDQVPIGVTFVSVIFVLGISYYIIQFNKRFKET